MRFDTFSVALLVLRPDAPALDDDAAAALQDARLAHLADLHDAGYLVAAGPLVSEPVREFRGLCILTVDPQRARELKEDDPAVRAGRFAVKGFPLGRPCRRDVLLPHTVLRSIADTAGG